MSSAAALETQASAPAATTPDAEATRVATASVEAEIAAATGRSEPAAEVAASSALVPVAPELAYMRDVPDGLLQAFLVQLGCDPDTPLADAYCVPESDLLEALTAMAYLGPI